MKLDQICLSGIVTLESQRFFQQHNRPLMDSLSYEIGDVKQHLEQLNAVMAGAQKPGVDYFTWPYIAKYWAVARILITNCLKKPDRNVEGYLAYLRAREEAKKICRNLDKSASDTERLVIIAFRVMQLSKVTQEALEMRQLNLDQIHDVFFSGNTKKKRRSSSW